MIERGLQRLERLQAVISDDGSEADEVPTFTYGGITYPCLPQFSPQTSLAMDDAGVDFNFDGYLHVRKSVLGNAQILNRSNLSFEGVTYKVMRVIDAQNYLQVYLARHQ